MTTNQTSSPVASDVIDVAELRQMMSQDPALRILDVRTGGEFQSAHIPGSYNVPLDTLGEHVSDLADVSHPVVLICQSGGRATKAHQELSHAGKDTLHILEGGMTAWTQAGGDVLKGDTTRWAMDRQVRLTAGLMIVGGVVLSLAIPGAQWLAGAVGAGLAYSAISNTCAMAAVLARLPYNKSDACDIEGVLIGMDRGPRTLDI